MALVRIFLLTCRRPALLPRALASLRAQTLTDWVCELHNDAPEDTFPRRLVEEMADPRITLHQHEQNWGAVAAFNHAFAGGSEPYASLLEDDNWWEPTFLAEAFSALEREPAANVAWANLRLWCEEADGSWTDTNRTIWQTVAGDSEPRLFHWPLPIQSFDALHSNAAMLYRAAASRTALAPQSTPFDIIEPVRERLLSGGWLFLPKPLGNFAQTLLTARAPGRTGWLISQLLVAASYQLAVRPAAPELAATWAALRAQRPPATAVLFHLALSGVRPFALLRHARPGDWLRFIKGAVRHPVVLARALRFRSTRPALWSALLAGARSRTREAAGTVRPSLNVFHKTLAPSDLLTLGSPQLPESSLRPESTVSPL